MEKDTLHLEHKYPDGSFQQYKRWLCSCGASNGWTIGQCYQCHEARWP